jgi:hypothetical protein
MSEHEGLLWLHRDIKAVSAFLSYRDPANGQIKPFCDAPEKFWWRRGVQTKWPLYNGLSVILYLVSPYKRFYATARVDGNCSFKIVEVIGTALNGTHLPRSIMGRDGSIEVFADGIWLKDVRFIDLEWPYRSRLKPFQYSRIARSNDWQILKNHTG